MGLQKNIYRLLLETYSVYHLRAYFIRKVSLYVKSYSNETTSIWPICYEIAFLNVNL